jgi:hypothetical protein
LQLVPRNLELGFGTLVFEAIEANVLHQYVQAMDEGAG